MADEATTTFDPAATSETYDDLLPEWTLNLTLAELHLSDLRDGDLLDEFGGGAAETQEATAQYAWRKAASVAVDSAQDLIRLRVDNIFRTPPVRSFAESAYAKDIEAFLADVDGAGTDMTAFMRRSLPGYYTNGIDFVVDKVAPPDGTEPLTLAQEQDLGLAAYVQSFGPQDRLDWSVTSAGRFIWARYSLGVLPSPDETDDGDDVEQWLTVTEDEWRLYSTSDKTSTVVEGTHTLGKCPIVPFYFGESRRPFIGPRVPLSLMTRISPIARYLVNLMSQIQIDVLRNIGFMVATGVEAEKIPKQIAVMGCWALPDGADLTQQSGDVAHIQLKIDFAEKLAMRILELGKVTGGSGESSGRATSAIQVVVERTDLDNEMRSTSLQLAEADQEIVRMAISRQQGKAITADELGYTVEYNSTFVLTDAGAMVTRVKEYFSIPGLASNTPGVARRLVTDVLNTVMRQDDDSYDEAKAEIDDTDFDELGAPSTEADETEDVPEGLSDEEDALERELT